MHSTGIYRDAVLSSLWQIQPPLQDAVQIMAQIVVWAKFRGPAPPCVIRPVLCSWMHAHACCAVLYFLSNLSFCLLWPFSLSCLYNVDNLETKVQSSGTLLFHFSAFCCLFLLLQENPPLVDKEYLFLLFSKACHKFQTANKDLMLMFMWLFGAFPSPLPLLVIPSHFLSFKVLFWLSEVCWNKIHDNIFRCALSFWLTSHVFSELQVKSFIAPTAL